MINKIHQITQDKNYQKMKSSALDFKMKIKANDITWYED